MIFETCELEGIIICRPKVFKDNRGYFKEVSRRNVYAANGIDRDFVQVNMSFSKHGVLRGLHYQLKYPQAKLISVAYGKIYDVVVDCRRSSKTFGRSLGIELTADGGEELFVPEGFAHGFYVRSECASVVYQCNDYYQPGDEFGLNWASPELAINWGTTDPIMSEKDLALPRFADIKESELPE
jgi:dTDP-4-dehydrorhamnose 3,5-epimerase